MIEIRCCMPVINWDALRIDVDKRSIYVDESETLAEVFKRTGISYPIPGCASVLYVNGMPDFDDTLRNTPIEHLPYSDNKLWVCAMTKHGLFGA